MCRGGGHCPPISQTWVCRFAKAQVQARLLLPLYRSLVAPSSLLENLCESRGSHLKCEAGGRGTCCARAVMPRRLTVKNHWSKQQLPEHPEPGGTRWLVAPCCSTAPQLAAALSCATSGVLCQREGHAAALLPGERLARVRQIPRAASSPRAPHGCSNGPGQDAAPRVGRDAPGRSASPYRG